MFEKVNPCHPDKVADRLAGAITDLAYTKSANPKVAVETLIGHGKATVKIESSEEFTHQEVREIVRRLIGEVELDLDVVKQDSHLANNQEGAIRCGDNGIFKGCPPTKEQRLLTDAAAEIYNKFKTDGKYILADGDYTICQSHMNDTDEADWACNLLVREFGANGNIFVNPLGPWTGGPDVDCGCTNRKLGSDMGDGVTGGGLHGKDLSKADVSVNIWCFIQACAIGRPVEAHCSIGDEHVNGVPYAEIVDAARRYINAVGGFEKFAEWGLIRPGM